jgi:hypothetical protein
MFIIDCFVSLNDMNAKQWESAVIALEEEVESDELLRKGFVPHAYGRQTSANRKWAAAFNHMPADPPHIYAKARKIDPKVFIPHW